jgi:hypothetical protein
MKDWKTTVTAIVTGVCAILSSFGIVIPDTWTGIIIAVGVIILGYFASDQKKSD